VLNIFTNSADWALQMITNKAKPEDSADSKQVNFCSILLELLGDDDDQEKLLIMDFLLIDHVLC